MHFDANSPVFIDDIFHLSCMRVYVYSFLWVSAFIRLSFYDLRLCANKESERKKGNKMENSKETNQNEKNTLFASSSSRYCGRRTCILNGIVSNIIYFCAHIIKTKS